jgi:hypothetical protein
MKLLSSVSMRSFAKILLLTTSLLFAFPPESPGATRLSAFVGYGISLFDGDFPREGVERGHAGFLPVSLSASWEIRTSARLGVEFNYSVLPFAFDDREGLNQATEKVSQLVLGSFTRYTLTESVISPYLKGGVGIYLGQWVIDYRDDAGFVDAEYDLKPSLGFSAGAGIIADWAGDRFLFLEFLYHLVSRELDISGAKRYKAGNLAVQFGMGSDL